MRPNKPATQHRRWTLRQGIDIGGAGLNRTAGQSLADPGLFHLATAPSSLSADPGEYLVADTGGKIQGRRLDIYLPSEAACRKFGRRRVKVRVLQLGDGTHTATKQADDAVKEDVSKDAQKNVVGNAATEDDWAAKRR